MTIKMGKVERGFCRKVIPRGLIFPPSLISLWECGKMRDPWNEVGFVGLGELNTMFYTMP